MIQNQAILAVWFIFLENEQTFMISSFTSFRFFSLLKNKIRLHMVTVGNSFIVVSSDSHFAILTYICTFTLLTSTDCTIQVLWHKR